MVQGFHSVVGIPDVYKWYMDKYFLNFQYFYIYLNIHKKNGVGGGGGRKRERKKRKKDNQLLTPFSLISLIRTMLKKVCNFFVYF